MTSNWAVRSFIAGVLSSVLLFSIFSCQTVPETNRSQLMIIGQGAELKMGIDAYREILKKSTLSQDTRLTAILRKVGRKIAQSTRRPGYQWEFNLIENDVPNAFALPGGKVGVHTGILSIAKNEAGLAAVIGHEVAHAIARHGAERMSQGLLIALAGEALTQGVSRDKRERGMFRTAYGLGTAVAITLPFSRRQELEADAIGLTYMARAGYDPREAKSFWERFSEYGKRKGKKGSAFLSTHPADSTRIKQIENLLPRAMEEYNRSVKMGAGAPIL